MAHWQHRDEANWTRFQFNQPYEPGLGHLRSVLETTDFDPATLWQWGTLQALAVIEILKSAERVFGAEGQRVVYDALHRVGLDAGRQILTGTKQPDDLSDAEVASFYATIINRIVYASLEEPTIDAEDRVSFHITYCPHQDTYKKFDCRVQRYFVAGMIDALKEQRPEVDWQVHFTQTIPAGAKTCHFELWQSDDERASAWNAYTKLLDEKALARAREGAES